MRLIDADTLIKQLENKKVSITYDIPIEEVLGEDIDLDDFGELVKDAINSYREMILDTIKTMPAIDERPKGEWILDKSHDVAFEWNKYKCSNCFQTIITRKMKAHNFCSCCGADMREVEET